MDLEDKPLVERTIFNFNGYTFSEEKRETGDGAEVDLEVVGENPRRFVMDIESDGTVLAKVVSSGIVLRNGDVKIDVDGENLTKSFESEDEMRVGDASLEKGIYWRPSENEIPQKVGFGNYGSLFLSPAENGVLANRSGQVIRGVLGSDVRVIHNGKLVATTNKAMSVKPIAGTLEIIAVGKAGESKLTVKT